MKITNKFGMPQPFVDFAINDKYSKGKADISVTSLIDSPKIKIMKEKYNDQIEVDALQERRQRRDRPVVGLRVHQVRGPCFPPLRFLSRVPGRASSDSAQHPQPLPHQPPRN